MSVKLRHLVTLRDDTYDGDDNDNDDGDDNDDDITMMMVMTILPTLVRKRNCEARGRRECFVEENPGGESQPGNIDHDGGDC